MNDESKKDKEEDVVFGDKFTRMIIGSIAGFFMTLFAEYLYTKWFIDKKNEDEKDRTEN